MIFLKIIGIVFAVIILLLIILLSLRIRLFLSFDMEKAFSFKIKVLFFSFDIGKEKKPKVEKVKTEKKPSPFMTKIKKKLGLDISFKNQDGEETPKTISENITRIVTLISLLAGQIGWLLRRFRLEKLRILAICGGGDAAESALEYGVICSTVYPFIGYLSANLDSVKDAEDVQIGCDFEGEPKLEFDFFVSIRIIHIIRALFRSALDMAELANEEAQK